MTRFGAHPDCPRSVSIQCLRSTHLHDPDYASEIAPDHFWFGIVPQIFDAICAADFMRVAEATLLRVQGQSRDWSSGSIEGVESAWWLVLALRIWISRQLQVRDGLAYSRWLDIVRNHSCHLPALPASILEQVGARLVWFLYAFATRLPFSLTLSFPKLNLIVRITVASY